MGGAANSYHLKGMAADIRVLGLAAEEAASLAEQAGFDGIGFTSSRVHVDVRSWRAKWQG